MAELGIPNFIDDNPADVLSALIADYESRTGKTLQPAQVERLLINAFAYRESVIRTVINETARQNLVAFATAPVLDYLGQLVGVTRIPAIPATTTIRFTLISSHTGVTIAENFQVATADGKATFAAMVDTLVPAGQTTVDIECEAVVPGTAANGYTVGQVNAILNPPVWMVSASNLNTTGGGADDETDEQLRERIKLAPAAFSNAGSRDAYKFFAASASPSIIDVAVVGPPDIAPGQVEIYPLVQGGITTPIQVIDAVLAACNDDRVRPLTDTVTVSPPLRVDYTLEISLVVLIRANQPQILADVTSILNTLTLTKYQKLGRNLTHSELIAACMIEGVYSVTPVIRLQPVNIITPELVISVFEYAFCTGVQVNITGTNPG